MSEEEGEDTISELEQEAPNELSTGARMCYGDTIDLECPDGWTVPLQHVKVFMGLSFQSLNVPVVYSNDWVLFFFHSILCLFVHLSYTFYCR